MILQNFRLELALHRGRVGKAERALRLPRGYLAKMARGKKPLRVDQLPQIFEALSVDFDSWMMHTLDRSDWWGCFQPTRLPHALQRFRSRLSSALRSKASRHRVTNIEALDLARYEDPVKAARTAHLETHRTESLKDLVLIGLAWSSATRMSGSLLKAGLLLGVLENFAWRCGPSIEGNLYRRVASLLRDHHHLDEAAQALRHARALYLEAGDHLEDSATLIDEATLAYQAGNQELAARKARSCIELVGREKPRYTAAAHLLLARIMGEVHHLDEAENLLSPLRTYDRLALSYGRASACPEVAEIELRKLLDLALLNPLDAAMVALDLSALMVQEGRTLEATEVIRGTMSLFGSLREWPAAGSVLLGLMEHGRRLNVGVITSARQAVKAARLSSAGPLLNNPQPLGSM